MRQAGGVKGEKHNLSERLMEIIIGLWGTANEQVQREIQGKAREYDREKRTHAWRVQAGWRSTTCLRML